MSISENTYKQIPGYSETSAALTRALEWRKSLDLPEPQAPITVGLLQELAMSGEGLPESIGAMNRTARELKDDRIEEINLLDGTVKLLKSKLSSCLFDGADEGLTYLDRVLRKLVKEVRAVPAKIARLSELEAYKAGGDTFDAWNRVEMLVKRYDQIRFTQAALVRSHATGGQVFRVGLIRNSLDYAPYWQDRRLQINTSAAHRDSNQDMVNYAEWLKTAPAPKYPHAQSHWPARDRRTYLLDLCSNDLWVPTIAVMNEAWESANWATEAVSRNSLGDIEAARDRFYEVTGTIPAHEYTNSPRKPRVQKASGLSLANSLAELADKMY